MKGTKLKQKKESNDNLETQINSCTNIICETNKRNEQQQQ